MPCSHGAPKDSVQCSCMTRWVGSLSWVWDCWLCCQGCLPGWVALESRAPRAPTPTGCSRRSVAWAPQMTRNKDCSSWAARRPCAKEPGQDLPWAQGSPRMRTPTPPEAELAEEEVGAAPGAQLTGFPAQAAQHGPAGPGVETSTVCDPPSTLGWVLMAKCFASKLPERIIPERQRSV